MIHFTDIYSTIRKTKCPMLSFVVSGIQGPHFSKFSQRYFKSFCKIYKIILLRTKSNVRYEEINKYNPPLPWSVKHLTLAKRLCFMIQIQFCFVEVNSTKMAHTVHMKFSTGPDSKCKNDAFFNSLGSTEPYTVN